MDLRNFLHAMEHIENELCQVIGAMKATILKQQRDADNDVTDAYTPPQRTQLSAVLPLECDMKRYKGKTIKRRADGRYWCRYYDKNKKQHSVYGHTINECLQKLKQALRLVENGHQISKTTTLGEWLNKWMELYKVNSLKPSTLEKMRRLLPAFAPLAARPLNRLTTIEVQEFLNSVQAPRKRECLHVMLKDALTKAMKCKLLDNDLLDGIKLPKRIKKRTVALTVEQEAMFVEACRQSNQGDLLLLCLYQGLRLGEALALTYDDVDFERSTISVTKSVDNLGNTTTPKTETSVRTIPMFQRTYDMLRRDGSGKLFTFSRKVYQNAMLRISKRLGFTNVSIHSLRHTFATRCAEIGISAKMTQQWLGHSTLDMTMNVYTHINTDFERKMTQQINAYFDTCKS